MKCAKLHLKDRTKPEIKSDDRPRRYCQKRMVNPGHEEDPRWVHVFDRFHCNDIDKIPDCSPPDLDKDLFLTVQNLQFNGNVQERKRVRTYYKYRSAVGSNKHRMFVKEIIDEQLEMDRVSELSFYYDDYSKYFQKQLTDSSRESSIILLNLKGRGKDKENKSRQTGLHSPKDIKKTVKNDAKNQKSQKDTSNKNTKDVNDQVNHELIDGNTKVSFHKYGKRKSLTISRTESPATVQVIRVDVICNYSDSSVISDYEENKQITSVCLEHETEKKEKINRNKYLLTNSVKTLDQNVKGGKVTLLCKTFKLTDRSKPIERVSTNVYKTKKYKLKN